MNPVEREVALIRELADFVEANPSLTIFGVSDSVNPDEAYETCAACGEDCDECECGSHSMMTLRMAVAISQAERMSLRYQS